jgi:hypothetical protein
MFTLLLLPTLMAAPVPAVPEGKPVEVVRHIGHFERNNSGLKGDVSWLVFIDAEAFGKVFAPVPPLMGKGNNKPNPVKPDAFDKNLVVAVVTRANAPTMYSDISAKLNEGTLIVTYTAATDPPGTATFASPLILSVPKDGIKRIVFATNGKDSAPIEVK